MCDLTCEPTTNLASLSSRTLSIVSLTTQRISKRDKMGSVSSTLSENVREESYLPPTGFAAAMTEHLACSDVTIPALEMEMDCCRLLLACTTRPPMQWHVPVVLCATCQSASE